MSGKWSRTNGCKQRTHDGERVQQIRRKGVRCIKGDDRIHSLSWVDPNGLCILNNTAGPLTRLWVSNFTRCLNLSLLLELILSIWQ